MPSIADQKRAIAVAIEERLTEAYFKAGAQRRGDMFVSTVKGAAARMTMKELKEWEEHLEKFCAFITEVKDEREN